jgi:hypothetical protein
VNALIDPSVDLRYQRAGIEIETGFQVNIPYGNYITLGPTTLAHSPHLKLVLDQATGLEDQVKIIPEIVSYPAAMLDGEDHTSSFDQTVAAGDVFKGIRYVLQRMKDAPPGARLGDIFPPMKSDVTIISRFQNMKIWGEAIPGKMSTQSSQSV